MERTSYFLHQSHSVAEGRQNSKILAETIQRGCERNEISYKPKVVSGLPIITVSFLCG